MLRRPGQGLLPVNSNAHGRKQSAACCTTTTGRGRRIGAPIRTWWPGSVNQRSWRRRCMGRTPGLPAACRAARADPGCAGPGRVRASGLALRDPHRPGRPELSDTGVGADRWTGYPPDRAGPRRRTMRRCGRWRSGTRRITFTWWRCWPARTGRGPGSGTTSTGWAEPVAPRNGGRVAVDRPGRPDRLGSAPRGRSRKRRPGVAARTAAG